MSVAMTLAVVAVGVGGLEVALEGDRHGQVADAIAGLAARDADEPDGGLAVSIRAELDHAGPSAGAAVSVA